MCSRTITPGDLTTRRRASVLLGVLWLSGGALITSCGGGGDPASPVTPVVVSLSPATLSISQGASGVVAVAITGGVPTSPSTLTTCASASVAIATTSVESSGCRIVGVSAGSTTITATVSTGQRATVSVTVTPPPPPALTALQVSVAPSSLVVGQTGAVIPTPTTSGAGVAVTYTYSSSAIGVAAVNFQGLVTGIAAGTAVITVTATGTGTGFSTAQQSATASVTVTGAALGVGFGLEQFASIPSGSYLRGKPNGAFNETPVRSIAISAFRMQKTEVTQGQWRQVMTGTALVNPSQFTACGDTCPVERVSWDDVQEFLIRLGQQDPGKGYRLPTEAEWEYATRAGTTGDLNVDGQAVEALGWLVTNAQQRTWPVAQKLPNAFGLFDTLGNVWEWVNDWYDAGYYATSPTTDPNGPPSGTLRARRGGSWVDDATPLRSAYRAADAPTLRRFYTGFRLARTP
jgi:formylglycine-generating enzyme required for sulfatase activity